MRLYRFSLEHSYDAFVAKRTAQTLWFVSVFSHLLPTVSA